MSELDDLFAAVQSQDLEAAMAMIDGDVSLLTARSETGRTVVLMARYMGATAIVDAILERGVTLDACEAAALGRVDRLEAIAEEAPASLHPAGADGFTPLHFAAFFGHKHAARFLLKAGVDVMARSGNDMSNTALHAAIAGERDHELIEVLLDAGAAPGDTAADDYTPLHAAASRGDAELIEQLLARGAIPAPMKDGKTMAEIAEEHGHADLAADLRGRF